MKSQTKQKRRIMRFGRRVSLVFVLVVVVLFRGQAFAQQAGSEALHRWKIGLVQCTIDYTATAKGDAAAVQSLADKALQDVNRVLSQESRILCIAPDIFAQDASYRFEPHELNVHDAKMLTLRMLRVPSVWGKLLLLDNDPAHVMKAIVQPSDSVQNLCAVQGLDGALVIHLKLIMLL